MTDVLTFIYKAPFDNGLTEHELDHILIGYYNDVPAINEEEVAAWRWETPENIKKDIEKNPTFYTEWFKIIFAQFYDKLFLKEKL